jgi:hypothetical protein
MGMHDTPKIITMINVGMAISHGFPLMKNIIGKILAMHFEIPKMRRILKIEMTGIHFSPYTNKTT